MRTSHLRQMPRIMVKRELMLAITAGRRFRHLTDVNSRPFAALHFVHAVPLSFRSMAHIVIERDADWS